MLVKWNPTQNLWSPRSLLEDFWGDALQTTFAPTFEPKVEVKENKNDYAITAELPGLSKNDFQLTMEGDILTLKGEKKYEDKKEDDNFHISERHYGSFCRSFRLTDEIKRDAISAHFRNGVLKVNLPKAEKAKPKEIPIKIN